jgi:hypothetical protein
MEIMLLLAIIVPAIAGLFFNLFLTSALAQVTIDLADDEVVLAGEPAQEAPAPVVTARRTSRVPSFSSVQTVTALDACNAAELAGLLGALRGFLDSGALSPAARAALVTELLPSIETMQVRLSLTVPGAPVITGWHEAQRLGDGFRLRPFRALN